MEDKIISILKNINKNLDNSGSNSPAINPEEVIPLEIPPTDSLYYRTYVDDVVYIGSSDSYSGYAGVDSLGNVYFNHRGEFTIENLKKFWNDYLVTMANYPLNNLDKMKHTSIMGCDVYFEKDADDFVLNSFLEFLQLNATTNRHDFF
jgi:hypothetical protein